MNADAQSLLLSALASLLMIAALFTAGLFGMSVKAKEERHQAPLKNAALLLGGAALMVAHIAGRGLA